MTFLKQVCCPPTPQTPLAMVTMFRIALAGSRPISRIDTGMASIAPANPVITWIVLDKSTVKRKSTEHHSSPIRLPHKLNHIVKIDQDHQDHQSYKQPVHCPFLHSFIACPAADPSRYSTRYHKEQHSCLELRHASGHNGGSKTGKL